MGLSGVYAWLGQPDSAFVYLEREVNARSVILTWGATHYYIWDPLRDDPRFTALLERLRLPVFPRRARVIYPIGASR